MYIHTVNNNQKAYTFFFDNVMYIYPNVFINKHMYIKLKQTILHIQKLEMKMKQTFILLQRILYQIQNILFDKDVYQSKLDLLSSKQGVGPLLLSFYLTCHLDYLKTSSQPYLLEILLL